VIRFIQNAFYYGFTKKDNMKMLIKESKETKERQKAKKH